MRSCQAEITRAMKEPGFYPHPVKSVAIRETHISRVFLTGSLVYKIKKPLNLGFLDFTSLEKRRYYCRQEVELNRRLAPDVYLGVTPVTREAGRYYLDGPGRPVEYAVTMRQLADEAAMNRLLKAGAIDRSSIDLLARHLARFYETANTSAKISTTGSWYTVLNNCEENFQQTEPFAGNLIDARQYQIIRAATRSFLRRRKTLFDDRVENGNIRDCHGDLRTGHVYFAENGIQIIDCIEFNKRFRYSDIAADLAFLTMDLDFEGYPDIARSLLDRYVQYTGDRDVFVLMNFYKCYRAVVRVKVNCFRLSQNGLDDREREALSDETRGFMDLAYRYAVGFTRPALWVICGMIASGKSTVARALSASLGIAVLRSDIVRKELFRLEPSASGKVPFGEGIYSREATSRTYGRLLVLALDELKAGRSVILDATFGHKKRRREALRLAQDLDADICFVECFCSESEIRKRLIERDRHPSVSDARLEHLEPLKSGFEPLHDIPERMHIRIDTGRSVDDAIQTILSARDGAIPCGFRSREGSGSPQCG